MTDRPSTSRFPAGCRRLLTELDGLVGGEPSREAAAHLAECARCTARLRAARRNAALLRGLGGPEIPAEVRSPQLLARIYERSTAISEQRIGSLLRTAMHPVKAPADPVWVESGTSPVESRLRAVFSGSRSPGWMWRRIRESIAEGEAKRRRPVALGRAGLLAAALLVGGLLVVEFSLGTAATKRGTSPSIPVVFETSAVPFEPALSLGSLAEAGR